MQHATALDASMAPRALPGWLPWLFVALLVAPFDPYWIDFENARRAQLLALSGLAITLWPRVMARYAPGSGALLVLTAWTCLAAIFTPSTTIWPQALLAIAQWLALLALLQLGGGADASCWRRAFGAALIATSLFGLLQRLGLADFYGYGQVSEPVSVFGNLNVAAEFTAIAGGAAAVAFARAPRTMALALVCAGAYALVNGSRSALVGRDHDCMCGSGSVEKLVLQAVPRAPDRRCNGGARIHKNPRRKTL